MHVTTNRLCFTTVLYALGLRRHFFLSGKQGICFLGKLKFDDFLRHYLGEAPGTIVERETGRAIGEHRGLWFHTIGQRKGVGPGLIPGYVNLGPWYVSGKDMAANVLEVTNDRDAIDGPRMSFQVRGWFLCFVFGYDSGFSLGLLSRRRRRSQLMPRAS